MRTPTSAASRVNRSTGSSKRPGAVIVVSSPRTFAITCVTAPTAGRVERARRTQRARRGSSKPGWPNAGWGFRMTPSRPDDLPRRDGRSASRGRRLRRHRETLDRGIDRERLRRRDRPGPVDRSMRSSTPRGRSAANFSAIAGGTSGSGTSPSDTPMSIAPSDALPALVVGRRADRCARTLKSVGGTGCRRAAAAPCGSPRSAAPVGDCDATMRPSIDASAAYSLAAPAHGDVVEREVGRHSRDAVERPRASAAAVRSASGGRTTRPARRPA